MSLHNNFVNRYAPLWEKYRTDIVRRTIIDALSWYEGRTYAKWVFALDKANPEKLISYISKRTDSCDYSIIIKYATTYLKRYCSLRI